MDSSDGNLLVNNVNQAYQCSIRGNGSADTRYRIGSRCPAVGEGAADSFKGEIKNFCLFNKAITKLEAFEIYQPWHPHPLVFLGEDGEWYCDGSKSDSCRKGVKDVKSDKIPRFHCRTCNYDLSDKCLAVKDEVLPDDVLTGNWSGHYIQHLDLPFSENTLSMNIRNFDKKLKVQK